MSLFFRDAGWGLNMSSQISVSVVIPAIDAAATIEDILQRLIPQADEILLADSSQDGTAELVQSRFPSVRVLPCPDCRSIEELRYRGLEQAGCEVVVLTEQAVLPGEGWIAQIRRAAAGGVQAGAGAVLPHPAASTAAWAIYFARYVRFMPPLPCGNLPDGSGLNVFYRRRLLEDHLEKMNGRFPETLFHRLLHQAGHRIQAVPEASVASLESEAFSRFFRGRFHSGRSYARLRAPGLSSMARLLRLLLCPALPLLLWLRSARTVLQRRRYAGPFVRCSAILMAYYAAWAAGEAAGYWRPKR
ncbi:MAG: glycosyltransferase [Acidobacteriota bacterium]